MNPNGSRDDDVLPETCLEEGHTYGCQGMAGGSHELVEEVQRQHPSWTLDCNGWVIEPLVNEGERP